MKNQDSSPLVMYAILITTPFYADLHSLGHKGLMDTDNFDRGKISLSRIPSIRPKKNSIGHQKLTEKHNKHYPTQVQFEVSLGIIIHYGRDNLQVTADILGA